MKKFIQHLRNYMLRGLLAIIPIFLSFLAIQLLYILIDKKVMAFLDRFIEVRQIPGLGILLVLVCLYLIGMIVSNVVGKQFFGLVHRISERIPIVNMVYKVGKQLSESLSDVRGKQTFSKVVLVDVNNNGLLGIAFVAGQIKDMRTGENLLRVFVPSVPNPATGFIFVVKESQAFDPGWTLEDGVKMVVSAAIISPAEIKKQ
jgi:uncharacterized membrane protein